MGSQNIFVEGLWFLCKYLVIKLVSSATDLSLRGIQRSSKLNGIVIATCCHHKCTWNSFHSKDYLGSFKDRTYFRILTLLSSWRTCGFEKSHSAPQEGVRFELSIKEKEKIGSKAKYVIDKEGYSNTNSIYS